MLYDCLMSSVMHCDFDTGSLKSTYPQYSFRRLSLKKEYSVYAFHNVDDSGPALNNIGFFQIARLTVILFRCR